MSAGVDAFPLPPIAWPRAAGPRPGARAMSVIVAVALHGLAIAAILGFHPPQPARTAPAPIAVSLLDSAEAGGALPATHAPDADAAPAPLPSASGRPPGRAEAQPADTRPAAPVEPPPGRAPEPARTVEPTQPPVAPAERANEAADLPRPLPPAADRPAEPAVPQFSRTDVPGPMQEAGVPPATSALATEPGTRTAALHPAPEPAASPRPAPLVPPRFDADYLSNPPPVYPALSRRNQEEGRVVLRVLVGADGRTLSVETKTSSGWPRLDRAAEDAVRRWRFVPAREGDRAVQAHVLVPLSFSLED